MTAFPFGANWRRFLESLDAERIERARLSLQAALGLDSLAGMSFLDVGCGSGLFSLAARRLGASVRSFDCDAESVACAEWLKEHFAPGDNLWTIDLASALDTEYLGRLGRFDVVYAWGSLHHTGDLWAAVDNLPPLVADGGLLMLAIYNDQGRASRRWRRVKSLYNRLPRVLRPLVVLPCAARLWGPTMLRDLLRLRPFHTWRSYRNQRGMSPWRDVVDWVGGWPFEVARPEEVLDRCRRSGFQLLQMKTCGGGHGCNEFVFRKTS
jgi:2-polyprenyl-6-hydroxyphenyl methylase/3-demethylubiquinone-9 3-methyltransferase